MGYYVSARVVYGYQFDESYIDWDHFKEKYSDAIRKDPYYTIPEDEEIDEDYFHDYLIDEVARKYWNMAYCEGYECEDGGVLGVVVWRSEEYANFIDPEVFSSIPLSDEEIKELGDLYDELFPDLAYRKKLGFYVMLDYS